MVRPKTEEEIALMRENGILVSKTLAEVGKMVAPGVTTLELNRVAETLSVITELFLLSSVMTAFLVRSAFL